MTRSEKKTSFTIDAGLPYVLAGDETTKFFVRPGITFNSTPVYDDGARRLGHRHAVLGRGHPRRRALVRQALQPLGRARLALQVDRPGHQGCDTSHADHLRGARHFQPRLPLLLQVAPTSRSNPGAGAGPLDPGPAFAYRPPGSARGGCRGMIETCRDATACGAARDGTRPGITSPASPAAA